VRFGVALSSASEFSMGPGLVADSSRCATPAEAESLAARIAHAQPGILTAVAVDEPNGWTVEGLPIREWLARL
jgi:hypothetical protein